MSATMAMTQRWVVGAALVAGLGWLALTSPPLSHAPDPTAAPHADPHDRVALAATDAARAAPRETRATAARRTPAPVASRIDRGTRPAAGDVDVLNLEVAVAIPLLRLALTHADPDHRRAAVAELADIAHPDAVDALLLAITDSAVEVRIAAVDALAQDQSPRSLDTLARALADAHDGVRLGAVGALAERADPDSAAVLAVAVADRNPRIRLHAVHALGDIGGYEAQRLLRQATRDQDAAVRDAAREILIELER